MKCKYIYTFLFLFLSKLALWGPFLSGRVFIKSVLSLTKKVDTSSIDLKVIYLKGGEINN